MAIKKKQPKRSALPYLAAIDPRRIPKFYNPDFFCKVSTYMGLAEKAGVSITLQALYARCRAGTIPCVYVDGVPFIICAKPVAYLLDKDRYIRNLVSHRAPGFYEAITDAELIAEMKKDPRVMICCGMPIEPII